MSAPETPEYDPEWIPYERLAWWRRAWVRIRAAFAAEDE